MDNPIKLCGQYSESRLCWSIAVSPTSKFKSIDDLKGCRVGISRFGSGSHIMPFVLGLQKGWIDGSSTSGFSFVVLKDIKGLLDAIKNDVIDCFLWEIITTKPYYDQGLVKMLDTVTTPWPAFIFASTNKNQINFNEFHSCVNNSIKEFINTFPKKGLPLIMNNDVFHYPNEADVLNWFKTVEYVQDTSCISKSMIQQCIDTLLNADLIDATKKKQWESAGKDLIESICIPSIKFTI